MKKISLKEYCLNGSLILLILIMGCSTKDEPVQFDILILNGTVFDGSGKTGTSIDIGILGDSIHSLGELKENKAGKIIDAEGLVVSPGFIDMHAHLDPIIRMPKAESHVRQGVTTALGGPDGGGPWPFDDYLDTLETIGLGMNVAYLTGHNRIRRTVMGLEDRAPTADELELMKDYVAISMEAGAFGISTGLKYIPGAYSEINEVIELSKIAAENGGIYTSHLREEGLGLIEGVQEAIIIGREANIPVVLTHHKAIGIKMWGSSIKTLSMVDSARQLGIDVMIDQYPYTASHTGIGVLIPSWAMAGGEFEKRVQDPILRDSIKRGIIFNILYDRGGSDLNRVQFSRVSWKPELEGKTLHDWAVLEEMDPTVENGAELVIQAQLNGGCSAIYHVMDEKDVQNIMKHPVTMIGSDGRLSQPGEGHPHPRAYGTFPRVLGHFSRDQNLMPLELAIHKMTGMPAQRLGLNNRGLIKEGYKADIVIFDKDNIIDKATFEDPHQYPEGVLYVIINGQLPVDGGIFSEIDCGHVLRKE